MTLLFYFRLKADPRLSDLTAQSAGSTTKFSAVIGDETGKTPGLVLRILNSPVQPRPCPLAGHGYSAAADIISSVKFALA